MIFSFGDFSRWYDERIRISCQSCCSRTSSIDFVFLFHPLFFDRFRFGHFYNEKRITIKKVVWPFILNQIKLFLAIDEHLNMILFSVLKRYKWFSLFEFEKKNRNLSTCFQEDLYRTCIEPMLTNVFDGYNVTIFAYGQTVNNEHIEKESNGVSFIRAQEKLTQWLEEIFYQ